MNRATANAHAQAAIIEARRTGQRAWLQIARNWILVAQIDRTCERMRADRRPLPAPVYVCRRCKYIGEENTIGTWEMRDDVHDRPLVRAPVEHEECPNCGSENYEKQFTCVECRVRPADEEGTDYCKTCAPVVEAREQAEHRAFVHQRAMDLRHLSGVTP